MFLKFNYPQTIVHVIPRRLQKGISKYLSNKNEFIWPINRWLQWVRSTQENRFKYEIKYTETTIETRKKTGRIENVYRIYFVKTITYRKFINLIE